MVEISRDNIMDLDEIHLHDFKDENEEEEDDREIMECPFKKFKFDSDEHASFVTKLEDPIVSNGGVEGIQPLLEPAGGCDGDVDGGSENGETTKEEIVLNVFICWMLLGGSEWENASETDEDNYEDIETLLDSALPDEIKNKKKDYEERFKIIMEGMILNVCCTLFVS